VIKTWDNLNVPLHALSPSWLAQPSPEGGVRRKPHIDPKVQKGYIHALDKLLPDEEDNAQVQSQLSKCSSTKPIEQVH
jgi:hypothetical protein